MKFFIRRHKEARRHLIILTGLFLGSFLLYGLGTILFSIHSVNFGNSLIIHFDFFQGITFLGDEGWVYRTIFLAGFLQCLNLFFAWFFLNRRLVLSYVFASGTLLFSLLIFTALLVIISVN